MTIFPQRVVSRLFYSGGISTAVGVVMTMTAEDRVIQYFVGQGLVWAALGLVSSALFMQLHFNRLEKLAQGGDSTQHG